MLHNFLDVTSVYLKIFNVELASKTQVFVSNFPHQHYPKKCNI